MSDPQPTIFVVDDEPAVLRSLARVLESHGYQVATFDSSRVFLEDHDPSAPGCVVLDVAMPGLNGLELQQALAARGASPPIVFLTGRGDVPTSVRAMKQGAVDFLTKPVDERALIPAVQAALANDKVAREIRAEVSEIRSRLASLTPREYEVLRHVVAGELNKQAAAALGTAEKTIKVHRARVMEKMNAGSLAELVRLAERAGVPAAQA